MKKTVVVFLLILLIGGCSGDSGVVTPVDEANYRKTAYESLTDQQKETITADWQEAPVYEGVYNNERCSYEFLPNSGGRMCFFPVNQDTKYTVNQKLIAVQFNTKDDSLLGPIVVIINPLKGDVTGYVGRL